MIWGPLVRIFGRGVRLNGLFLEVKGSLTSPGSLRPSSLPARSMTFISVLAQIVPTV